MTESQRTSPLLDQLEGLCAAHPIAPKYVFVPRVQLGRAVEDALGRDRKSWAGLQCLIPRHYAERLAEPAAQASGRVEVPVGGKSILAARVMEDAAEDDALQDLPESPSFASAIGRAIDTLRLGGVGPEAAWERAGRPEAADSLRAVARCYDGYLSLLEGEALYDDANVFRWATKRVRAGAAPEVGQAVFAVCNGTELPERAYQFLRALQAQGHAFYRIGASSGDRTSGDRAPAQSARTLFPGTGPPPQSGDANPGSSSPQRFRRAVGAFNEVRAVFRDILADEVPLDDVEIAYTDGQPYLALIADTADRLGVPVSIGTGLPGRLTRTGQALRGFLEWAAEDFEMAILIRLLRMGHVRLDRALRQWEVREVTLEAHEAATLLAGRQYEAGRHGYRSALDVAIEDKERRIRELQEKGLRPDRTREEKSKLELLRRVVDELAALAPRETTAQAMARNGQRFLETFGPVDPPPEDKPEEERTMEEAARAVIWQKLGALTRLPFSYESSGKRLAQLFRDWIDGQYVRAEHPRPGAAHVLPLESAGYSGRSHLYVVGFDSDTFSAAGLDDVALGDADREALSEPLEGTLPAQASAPSDALWRAAQALGRRTGPATLYTRTFDISEGEERYPSSLFLRLERRARSEDGAGGDPEGHVIGFLPRETEDVFLTDSEAWLAAYRTRSSARSAPPADPASEPEPGAADETARETAHETAREALRGAYPWIAHGEEARRARRSDAFTTHDGLLTPGLHLELDFLSSSYDGEPLSAGRLETLGETPYIYFLKHVLGARPLDEPALDDEPWLNRRRRGTLLHRTFAAFMERLEGAAPAPGHEELLERTLGEQLDREMRRHAPPNEATERAARRQLRRDAHLFLRAEVEHADGHDPIHHEIGFGLGPYRRQRGDLEEAAAVDVGEGKELRLRGRIDRVDRRADGTLAIWDYKTGSMSGYDAEDPLGEGATLQWAVYAYALEALTGETVARSGYFFTSADAMGERLAFAPAPHRSDATALIRRLAQLARQGCFPMNPRARYISRWEWAGYERLFSDIEARSRELQAKEYPSDRPAPPFLS